MTSTTAADKLQDLARRIAKQESALTNLRRRLDSRLDVLHRRREGLRAQLRSIEAEMEAASSAAPGNGSPAATATPPQQPSAVVDSKKLTVKEPTASRGAQVPLRSMILDVLKKAGSSLAARHVADAVLKAGYQTKSKRFVNVICVTISKMSEVERDPKGGYRLKMGKK